MKGELRDWTRKRDWRTFSFRKQNTHTNTHTQTVIASRWVYQHSAALINGSKEVLPRDFIVIQWIVLGADAWGVWMREWGGPSKKPLALAADTWPVPRLHWAWYYWRIVEYLEPQPATSVLELLLSDDQVRYPAWVRRSSAKLTIQSNARATPCSSFLCSGVVEILLASALCNPRAEISQTYCFLFVGKHVAFQT